MWETLKTGFYQTFILDNNYMYFVQGIGITLLTTVLALLIGLALGIIVALVRSAHDQQQAKHRNPVLGFFNVLANIYLTVIRGTPAMVQLLIMWFVIWASARSTTQNMVMCAVMTFGINSGAYVAEIIRSGIMSIDKGQMEAARSLGLSYFVAMKRVVLPQAIRTMIPSIINQFIITLKDTSILSVIGFPELVNTAKNVQANTFMSFQTWFIVGIMYLVVITILSRCAKVVERRLNRGR